MDPAATCSGLIKRYGATTAVDDLELSIRRGECFGLLGPNGAGKTTTVEIFEGLTTPDAGRVEVLGMPWGGKFDHRIRQRIGVQLQESQLGDKLTVVEVLTLFSSLYEQRRPLEQLVNWFELEPKMTARYHQLSGEQKQRVCLACALVSDPELLFLDEPTTGLDPQARRKVWDVIADYQARGGTVVLTSHYMEECQLLCDRVAIMDHGKLIALGTPDELIAGVQTAQLVEFQLRSIGTKAAEGTPDADAATDGDPTTLPASVRSALSDDDVTRRRGWWSLGTRDVAVTLPRLLDALRQDGVELASLRTREPTLEDVFLELTGRSLRDD